jgi:hypothetical protein
MQSQKLLRNKNRQYNSKMSKDTIAIYQEIYQYDQFIYVKANK